jgi:hypothetical protein
MRSLPHLVEEVEWVDVALVDKQLHEDAAGLQVHRLKLASLQAVRKLETETLMI